MKNKDLYIAIGDIDEKFVEEAAKAAENHRLKMRAAALRIGTAAACVVLAAVAVPLALSLRGETTELHAGETHESTADTRTDETDKAAPDSNAPAVDSHDNAETPDTVAPEPEFVIENGVLWNYNGDDTDVVIPDNVIEIAETAFENSPQVESVTLGKNTEYVAPNTFFALPELKNVYIPEENTFYESVDEKTIVNKGDLLNFESINQYSNRLPDYDRDTDFSKEFDNYLKESMSKKIGINRLGKFSVGEAVFETELIPDSDPIISENDLMLTAITVHGRRIDFDRFREIYGDEYGDAYFNVYGNRYFQAFWADDVFVVSSTYYGSGLRIVVTEDDVFVCVCDSYNERGHDDIPETRLLFAGTSSTLLFFERDGKLCYERIPSKFSVYPHQEIGGIVKYCVGRDELYQETGTVEIDGDEIRAVPETKITVSEAFDLEKEYAAYWGNDLEGRQTLDEWLAFNNVIALYGEISEKERELYQKAE